jgi:glucokinase
MSHSQKSIGIDFGGTSIKSAVVHHGKIVARGETLDPAKHESSLTLIEALFDVISALRKEHPEIAGVGIGFPGFVDCKSGIVHTLTNVKGWHEVPMVRMLRERTGLKAAIENDANAMAYAEFLHGAAKGAQNAVCITLGTGVGCGLVLDGKLFRGTRFAGGEMGHMSIDLNGPRGVYGTPGDLEVYVGNKQIAERAARLFTAAGRPRSVADCTPADLAKLAANGDTIAVGLWEQIGTEIGAALANSIWLLNPDAVVIGGGVAKAGDLVMEPIRRTIRDRVSPLFHEQLKVVVAELGNDAGIIGCGELALESN